MARREVSVPRQEARDFCCLRRVVLRSKRSDRAWRRGTGDQTSTGHRRTCRCCDHPFAAGDRGCTFTVDRTEGRNLRPEAAAGGRLGAAPAARSPVRSAAWSLCVGALQPIKCRQRRDIRGNDDGRRRRPHRKRCSATLRRFSRSGWLCGRRPEPRHQFVDAFLRPAVHEACKEIGEIRLWIDVIQLTGLCRPPNYAERFRDDTRLSRCCRLSRGHWLRTIRHSLVAQSASRKASNRSLGRKRVWLPPRYGLSLANAASLSLRCACR